VSEGWFVNPFDAAVRAPSARGSNETLVQSYSYFFFCYFLPSFFLLIILSYFLFLWIVFSFSVLFSFSLIFFLLKKNLFICVKCGKYKTWLTLFSSHQALRFLHEKHIPYGHLHSGNVLLVAQDVVQITDLENAILGLPARYKPYMLRLPSIQVCCVCMCVLVCVCVSVCVCVCVCVVCVCVDASDFFIFIFTRILFL
jgi:hypothetical protein